MKKDRVALIDGDILIHRCTVVFDDQPKDLGNGLYQFDFEAAVRNVKAQVRQIIEDVDAAQGIFCVSGSRNFRKELVDPAYKGNRVGRKPILFSAVKAALFPKCGPIKSQRKDNLEADDLLGILATCGDRVPGVSKYSERVMCTIDKDLLTVPGLHWNFDKQEWGDSLIEVGQAEADRRFFRQTIAGDRGDGYFGAPGFGPKSAERTITEDMEDAGEMWAATLAAFEEEGLGLEDALQNARCARILTAELYDFDKREVRLWEPTKGESQ